MADKASKGLHGTGDISNKVSETATKISDPNASTGQKVGDTLDGVGSVADTTKDLSGLIPGERGEKIGKVAEGVKNVTNIAK